MSPIIDIYTHIFPQHFFDEMLKVTPMTGNIGARLRSITKLFDLDARFRDMDAIGDYRQIISLPNPAIEDIAPPDVGRTLRVSPTTIWPSCAVYIRTASRPLPRHYA